MNEATAAHAPLTVYGRSSSHFTRIVRIFAHELEVPLRLVPVHDLGGVDPEPYGMHPALRMPTLHVGGAVVFGTENVCRKLAVYAGREHDPKIVLGEHAHDDLVRSAQELVWLAMGAQVTLRVGVAVCKLPRENPFFVKATAGLRGALAWLEDTFGEAVAKLPSPRDTSMLEVSLFCLFEHLVFLPSVPLDPYPRLRAFCVAFGARASARSCPYRFDPVA